MRTRHVMLLTMLLVLALATANAAADSESYCQKSRYYAAAKYAACEQQAVGKFYYYFHPGPLNPPLEAGKCQTKYTRTWSGLQASNPGSECDNPRFEDNGDGTVTDRLTGLQWEKKTDDATIHDKDNKYGLTQMGSLDDGQAFTTFLAALNSGGCFAGQCDWRLPTQAELQTILLLVGRTYCDVSPCIDAVFGPTVAAPYWSATDAAVPFMVWTVNFDSGLVLRDAKASPVPYVRAVRGGL